MLWDFAGEKGVAKITVGIPFPEACSLIMESHCRQLLMVSEFSGKHIGHISGATSGMQVNEQRSAVEKRKE